MLNLWMYLKTIMEFGYLDAEHICFYVQKTFGVFNSYLFFSGGVWCSSANDKL